MKDSEQIDRVVTALGRVPEKSLLIIELANKYTVDGEVDYEGLANIQPEVNRALAEAKMYGSHTMVSVDSLKRMAAAKDEEEDDV